MSKVKIPNKKSSGAILGIVIVLLIAGLISFYYYNKYQQAQNQLLNPTNAAKQEVDALVSRVGALMLLPNETPTVATVSDVNKLKNQPFFANAKNGFKVLLYAKAKKAILYDPEANKIIEVQTLSLGTSQATPAPQKLTIAIYNGTNTVGLTKSAESTITSRIANITVTVKDNAVKRDYTDTLVIDVSGRNTSQAQALAQYLHGKVSSLPAGEASPSSDLLVILGSSFTVK